LGDSLWSRTFGGWGLDRCYCSTQTSDGGYALAGTSSSPGALLFDYWLVKTGADNMSVNHYPQDKIPKTMELQPSFPNPFNSSAGINLHLSKKSGIKLSVFNINGQKISDLFTGEMNEGEHRIIWEASNVESGIYFVRLSSEQEDIIQKVVLLK
jgi:hypothetical protein